MSCQQAPKIIPTSTITSTGTREDPYIFSDNLPSAPFVSFHIQKPRKTNTPIRRVTPKKLPLAQLNGLVAQHAQQQQQQQNTSVTIAATGHASTLKTVSPNVITKQQQQSQGTSKPPTNPSNVCIVRPQQQQSTPPQTQTTKPNFNFKKLQLIQKPYTQLPQHTALPTPSLWHTPLFLNTIESPPTSPASLPSPTNANTTIDSCATNLGSTNLPPSNFLHTTFAQHLQKVGCIRKIPPAAQQQQQQQQLHANSNTTAPRFNVAVAANQVAAAQEKAQSAATAAATVESLQHSDTELNEIPVNVIYRSPPKLGDVSCKLLASPGTPKAVATLKPQLAVLAQQKIQDAVVSKPTATPPPLSIPSNAVLTKLPTTNAFLKQKALSLSQWGVTIQKTCHTTPTSSISGGTSDNNQTSKAQIEKPAPRLPVLAKKAPAVKAHAPTPRQKAVDVVRSQPLIEKQSQVPESKTNTAATATTATASATALTSVEENSTATFVACSAEPISGFAVVTLPQSDSNFESLQPNYPPYYLQRNWLSFEDARLYSPELNKSRVGREDRISKYKVYLLRQAQQLQSTKSLLQKPLTLMKKRLLSVKHLLRKHKNHNADEISQPTCQLINCSSPALPLAKYCFLHIFHAADQQLFHACTAKLPDNSQCGKPAIDFFHKLPLCNLHWRGGPAKMQAADAQQKLGQQQQRTTITTVTNKAARKRRSGSKPVGRPQKRCRKNAPVETTLSLASKQRKNSSTSLESIWSSSHSSQSQSFGTNGQQLGVPALAPLSKFSQGLQAPDLQPRQKPPENTTAYSFNGLTRLTAPIPEANEFNRICAQYAMEADNSSSFPKQATVADEMLLNVCENSSAYASSEDTGIGGLSESELVPGGQMDDIGGISLGDTRLLEENDLTNVLNSLTMDAFSEIFTSIRSDDDIERALGIAGDDLDNKMETGSTDFLDDFLHVNDHLLEDAVEICSKITLGSSSILHSPETSGIETATLFADAGSNSEDCIGSDYGDIGHDTKTQFDEVPTAAISDIVRDLVQA